MGLIVDDGYRTSLGTPFYDRREELERLDTLIHAYKLVIVYGPRNVGKSELMRYWGKRRARQRVITFQADLVRAGGMVEGLDKLLLAPEERVKRMIISELKRYAAERLNLLSLALMIYDAVQAVGGETVLFLDEYHMLPGYSRAPGQSRYDEALRDLEALAHRLAKTEDERLRVVLTVSEGFIATGEAFTRLHGYRTSFMLVEEMDEEHYSALYEHYKRSRGCHVDYHLIRGLAGATPGYLAELCRGADAVAGFIEASKIVLENGLSALRNDLLAGPWRDEARNLEPRRLIRLAREVVCGATVKPVEEPVLYTIGQLLTTRNITYPSYGEAQVVFKPQIPLYCRLLEIAVEKNVPSILGIKVSEVLERVAPHTNY